MVLTAAGEVLINHVRQTLRGMKQIVGHIEALKGLQQGEVSVGIASGLAGTLIPAVVPRVQHIFGRVRLDVRIMSAVEIAGALGAGEFDLGLGFNLPTGGLHVMERRLAPLGAVVAARHPLSTRASVSLDECAGYPLCVARAPLTLRNHLERGFAAASVPFRPAMEMDSIELMRCMARDGQFITFLSSFDMCRERHTGSLVYVPVRRVFADPEALILVARKRDLSTLAARVGEIFRSALAEM